MQNLRFGCSPRRRSQTQHDRRRPALLDSRFLRRGLDAQVRHILKFSIRPSRSFHTLWSCSSHMS